MSNWNLRFYRRKQIAPGVVLNFSRSGVSTTLGPRQAHITLGRRGLRETIEPLPGSGLYLTRQTPWQPSGGALQRGKPEPPVNPAGLVFAAASGFLRGMGWVALAVLGLAAIGSWLGH